MYFSGSTKPRQIINLSSGSSTQTASSLLSESARLRRDRDDQRKREASARLLQRVFRSSSVRKQVKRGWREDVEQGRVRSGVEAVRKVVLGWQEGVGGGRQVGRSWWEVAREGSPPSILLPLHSTPEQARFIDLLKMLVNKILVLASTSSASRDVTLQLNVLLLLLSPSSYPSLMSQQDYTSLTRDLAEYACSHGAIRLLSSALTKISPTDRKHPNLPLLTSSLAILLSTPFPSSPTSSNARLASTLLHLLTLPLLPNRLPIPSLTTLVKALPLIDIVSFAVTPEGRSLWSSWGRDNRLDALGNLAAFGVARISSTGVKPAVKEAWASLLKDLLGGLVQPIEVDSSAGAGGLAGSSSREEEQWEEDDAESSSGSPRKKQRTTAGRPPPPISPKLRSHLNLLVSPGHLNALLTSPSPTPSSLAFVLAILAAWPTKRDGVLSEVGSKRGLVKDLFRSEVRGGKVMRKVLDGSKGARSVLDALGDPSLHPSWTSFLLLTLLHTHLLHSLGDDEFFSPTANPLSLDETVSLSAIYRNIAFALYWNAMPEGKLSFGWEAEEVRTVCERAMASVYERDQRQPFTPEGHWLMTEQFDVNSFVEAAISEEHEIDAVNDDDPMDVDEEGVPIPSIPRPKKTLSRRHLAYLSPRLGVLNNIPQTVPFELRVEIFRAFIANDRRRLGIDRYARNGPRYHTTIRRGKVAEDSYAHLNAIGAGLKNIIQITFKDSFGQDEAGIDGGGVFKELLTELSTEVFNTDRGLWQATKQQELYPSPTSYAAESHQLDWYQFIGRVLGKALYEGILVDVAFAGFFLSKWLGRHSYFDDLKSLDEELYRGLIQLKQYEGDLDDLALTFTVDVQEFGVTSTVELVPGGAQIPVTKENRLNYIDLVSSFKLNSQIKRQTEAFFVGLADIIDPRWIRMFDPRELQTLVGGLDTEIDISDLRSNTVVHGLSEVTERAFWTVVKGFDPEQRRKLIKFVTSSPRPPMLGFKELSPSFSIRAGQPDPTRLPTSATCINLLKLPPYSDAATLREKLLQAISSESGFDLS